MILKVSKLKVGGDSYIEDQFEILEEEKKFYESLYRSSNINPINFKNSAFFNPCFIVKEKTPCCTSLQVSSSKGGAYRVNFPFVHLVKEMYGESVGQKWMDNKFKMAMVDSWKNESVNGCKSKEMRNSTLLCK